MKSRTFLTVLSCLGALVTGAAAQESPQPDTDQGGIVGPMPRAGLLACYQLVDEPKFCVLPDVPKVYNHTLPFNIIDLNGAWKDQSGNQPYIYIYNSPSSAGGYSISVDLSLVNRPDGFGSFQSGSAMQIVFPDDRDYVGTIDPSGLTIRWSNGTVWTKQ